MDDGRPVDLSPRYLDALILMVGEAGSLVTKDRFHDEVWRGIPVTDEALTQCIRALRRSLGDDAARPRFIATAPKHGYRFIAPVDRIAADARAPTVAAPDPARPAWRTTMLLFGAGVLGAGAAGIVGGLLYGIAAGGRAAGTGIGGASTIIVMLWLTLAVALMGGAGVSAGIAVAMRWVSPGWRILGGALGGLLVGGLVNLVGLDAFDLLLGRSPAGITGAPEGLLLGAGVGAGAFAAARWRGSLVRATALAGLIGAAAAVAVILLGGRLMGGSLDLLARSFPDSRLAFARLFGPAGLSGGAGYVTAALEGLLFAACLNGAMQLAERRLAPAARQQPTAF
nr:winged helix-turn-helix domain-containing protein [Sphingomonas jejuensis]